MNSAIQNIINIGWQTAKNQFYNITTTKDKQTTSNRTSYYRDLFPNQDFSVEVSNNKMLTSLDETGLIKGISFFRDAYYTEDKPGTWVSNGFVQEEKIATTIEFSGKTSLLTSRDHQIDYDLMFNLIPRYFHYYQGFKVLQLFLPLYLESGQAISGVVELCAISDPDKARLHFPKCYNLKYSDRHHVEFNYYNQERITAAQSSWVVLMDPNAAFNVSDNELQRIIVASYQHLVHKYGQLKMPDNPQLAALIMRKCDSSLNSISAATDGHVVGANWGSSPVINRTWLRDMFYASLPAIYFDHDLAKKVILWFAKYEIKPHGDKFNGGIQHSVENSLNSTILLTLYLKQTGDNSFLKKYPQLWQHVLYIVNYLLVQRDQQYGLIKSQWISDGIALGEFHTGTQITFWKAVAGISMIYRQVFSDKENATYYGQLAAELKKQIKQYCMVTDSYGTKKFLEGSNPSTNKLVVDEYQYEKDLIDQGLDFLTRVTNNHRITMAFHDGEESDTTLVPFYGFDNVLSSDYLNTLKFAASTDNPSYSSLSRGISWGNQAEATFPGYITLLMGTVDDQVAFNDRIALLTKLADLDGSWWWWPYEVGASGKQVKRFNHCGKCGWSDGIFSGLMIKNILGIDFNAQKAKLKLTPLQVVPNFNWQAFPLVSGLTIDINYCRQNGRQVLKVKLHGPADRTIKVSLGDQPSQNVTTSQEVTILQQEEKQYV